MYKSNRHLHWGSGVCVNASKRKLCNVTIMNVTDENIIFRNNVHCFEVIEKHIVESHLETFGHFICYLTV